MKFATIAEPPKLRNGVTTPVSGTRPSIPAPMTSTGSVRNSVSTRGQEEAVVVRRAQCGVEAARRDDREDDGDREQPDEAELFTDRGEHQVGVARRRHNSCRRDRARFQRSRRSTRPQIACAICSPPRAPLSHSDCHIATARGQRRGDVQRVADVEAGNRAVRIPRPRGRRGFAQSHTSAGRRRRERARVPDPSAERRTAARRRRRRATGST